MTAAFDRRLTPARPDLAAAHLRGKVEATRFAEGTPMRVVASSAPLRAQPSPEMPLDTQALHGEIFTVYESTEEGWSWGQLVRDGYVGWLPSEALSQKIESATHRVRALRALVFPKPDIKSPLLRALPFGSLLAAREERENFITLADGGFVPKQHVAAADYREKDFVEVAARFLGTPYLWGGKTASGLDCSGLVQVALQSAGTESPRDSDMQQALGRSIGTDISIAARGDLVFWKGHVGIVSGENRLLHANAHHMMVAEEPLDAAAARIASGGSEILAIRRPR
ncbi:MAG: C40 family peptidase [Xanthobacteraceae bacterium]|nr:C40 family peptidase [Xanthobacteraceae bacterium]QYK45284.1 MAG: C40 family peptidase [Xanthobacteraceae bacterium]